MLAVWDLRRRAPIFTLSGQAQDYISSMVTNNCKRYLACTSGDGTVTTINLFSRKFYVQSEGFDSEYTCAGLYNDDKKYVVGTANGKFVVYNWGEFGLHNDMFPGPTKRAINCQVAIANNITVTGWEDGVIRANYLFPNVPLGIVGQHSLSVDALDISHDGEFIASASLDQKINFWQVSYFNELDYSSVTKKAKANLPSSKYDDRSTFFADLAE